MELPEALSPRIAVQVETIYQAIEASTQSPLEHVRKPAEQLLKACEEIPGYTSVLALIAGTRGADADARVAAVILLKNMVRIRWRSRGGGGFVVGEGEKAVLKGFLLEAMDEPEENVASQLSVLMGKIARIDWPRAWPELFPSLVNSLVSGDATRRRMALCGTDEVLRELCTKRVGFDKAAFIKTAGELLPVLCRGWDAQWARVEGFLMPMALGRGKVSGSGAGPEDAAAVALANVCIKIIRRLLQFGIPGLDHPRVEPFFHGLLQRMTAVLAALQQHQRAALQASSGGAGTKDGQDGMVEELQDLAERMAGAAVDAQKEHPIGFRRYLAAYLAFFHEQLVSAAQAAAHEATSATSGFLEGGGRVSSAEEEEEASSSSPSRRKGVAYPCYPFCIRCMAYLANVVGCSSYREDLLERAAARPAATPASSPSSTPSNTLTGRGAGRMITAKGDAAVTSETAHEISSVLVAFYTGERVVGLLGLLLEAFLPLTASDLEEWRDFPEQYYLLQDSLEPRESVSAEHLFSALLEASGRDLGGVLARAVSTKLAQGVDAQLEACRQTSLGWQQLRLDALYLCAGLGAYTIKQYLDFEGWLKAFLSPALEALVSAMRIRAQQESSEAPPAVLLRRLMWLLGCWSEQIPVSLRPPLVQATANVMKAQEADVVVRLSALNALHAILGLWDLDPDQCLAPSLGWLVPALYDLFEEVEEMESRQQVLTVMSELLERSGNLLVPHCQAAVAGLPNVWMASSSQTPLRCSCLQVMKHVVEALGRSKGPDLDRVAVSMVDVATKVGSEDAVYLMESGLELWLALLRHAPDYDETLHNLFPRIPAMLEDDLDHLKQAMLIIEAHVVVGGKLFLQAHGSLVCCGFCRVVGQVKPQGAAFVSRALETILRKFPLEGSLMLGEGGVLRKVLEACLVTPGDGGAREPDLVIIQHLTVLCRVLVGAPDCFRRVVQQLAAELSTGTGTDAVSGSGVMNGPDRIMSELVRQMTTLFDSAGYSTAGVWRRRLWAIALLHVLPSANGGVVSNLDQIVNVCVDVLTEETEDGGKRLKEALDEASPDGTEGSSSPTDLLHLRLQEELRADVAVVTDLRLLIRTSMDALRAALGDAGWQAAVETVEPVVLKQLQAKVA